jgi:hypothetical protein
MFGEIQVPLIIICLGLVARALKVTPIYCGKSGG